MTRQALVIDDSHQAADTLVKMLNLLGYQVKVAYGPRAAIEGVTRQFPDVILLDIHMPGVDGVEVCRYIRRDPRTAHVPILAMSTDTQEDMVARIRAAGANGFLAKPIEFDDLEHALQQLEKPSAPS